MIDPQQLERLIGEPESPWVERKASPSDMEKIRRTVCAFANDLVEHRSPGYILVGVDDQGEPTGLPIDDRLLQQLSFIKDNGKIQPLPQMTVERAVVKDKAIAVITVWPSGALPVRYDGVVWVRSGPRLDRASPEMERRLLERSIAVPRFFDQRPCLEASLADLDLRAFQVEYLPLVVDEEVLRENHRTIDYQLASLRFFDIHRRVPTHAGVLAFGKDPLRFLPGAYVQFVRYAGTDRAAPVQDHKMIKGRLREQLLQLDALLPIQITTQRVQAQGLRFEDRPDYPKDAIRELVLNAVMHRTYEGTSTPVTLYWYQDRVEVQSPGNLFGQVTPENFTQVTDYRNPTVAEVLKGLGYVDRYGRGIARTQASLQENGNPPPQFTFEPTHVLVKILPAQPQPSRRGQRGRSGKGHRIRS